MPSQSSIAASVRAGALPAGPKFTLKEFLKNMGSGLKTVGTVAKDTVGDVMAGPPAFRTNDTDISASTPLGGSRQLGPIRKSNALSLLNTVARKRAAVDFSWADNTLNADTSADTDPNSAAYKARWGVNMPAFNNRMDAMDMVEKQYRDGVLNQAEAEHLMRNPTQSGSYVDPSLNAYQVADNSMSQGFNRSETPYAANYGAAQAIAAANPGAAPAPASNMRGAANYALTTAAPSAAPSQAPAPANSPVSVNFAAPAAQPPAAKPAPAQVAQAAPRAGIFVGGKPWQRGVTPQTMLAANAPAPMAKPSSLKVHAHALVGHAIKESLLQGMTGTQWKPPTAPAIPKTPASPGVTTLPKPGKPATPAKPAKPVKPISAPKYTAPSIKNT